MRTLLALVAVAATALSGCIAQPSQPLEGASVPPAAGAVAEALEPVLATWEGRITASQLGMLAHSRDTEMAVRDVQREGFVFEITEPPQDFWVDLAWQGEGSMLVMVSSPSVDGKGVEYFSDFVAESPVCIRIPAGEIIPGKWQVMAHSRDARDVDFTFTAATVGGAASILEGEPHSSAEATETTEGEALACDEPEDAEDEGA